MLTPADMDEALGNIDRRLNAVEQILPTLATKEDLRQGLAESSQHTNVLFEAMLDRFALLAEGMASLQQDVRSLAVTVAGLVTRTDDNSAQIRGLVRQLRRKGVI